MNLPCQPPEEFPDPADAEGESLEELLAETQDILSDPALEIPPAAEVRYQIREPAPAEEERSVLAKPVFDADDLVDEESIDSQLDELAMEFVDRYRDGQRPTIGEYADLYPDLAEEIRDLFPTIAQMEGLKVQADEEDRQARGGHSNQGAISGELKLTQLGDFRIIREIGRGGMGVVYEAEQTSLKRTVAVKVLPLLSLLKPELAQRFEREARTAAQLHHTNIVPVFGFGQFHGFHYYVMQLIEGIGLDELFGDRSDTGSGDSGAGESNTSVQESQARQVAGIESNVSATSHRSTVTDSSTVPRVVAETLHEQRASPLEPTDRSRRQPAEITEAGSTPLPASGDVTPLAERQNPLSGKTLTVRDIADIGAQAAGAIAYAHDQGTLHRDIKPGNLLMDPSGQVWVADFGLAKAMEGDEITQSGNVVGTVRYMAPEQLRGENDPRSDIYSLGITLYELLTGRRAWSATERNRLIQQVLSSDLPPAGKLNPEVPRDLETIVAKATAKEPEHRYQTAGELEADLRRFLDDRPIRARPIGPLERAIRWSRRNPVVASLSGLSAGLLMLVAVVGFIGYRAESEQRQRAEETSTNAVAVLDKIFDRFAPDQAVALTGAAGGSGPAVVSDETAALLEDLLAFYDQLASLDEQDEALAEKRADARRRVGDIRQRLGRHPDAVRSYRESLTQYDLLQDRYPGDETRYTISRAQILNGIGTSQRMINQQSEAAESHSQALRTLESLAADQLKAADTQYELARSHYLLAFRLRPGEGPVDDESALILPEDLQDGPPRPGERPFGPEGPQGDRLPGQRRPVDAQSVHDRVSADRVTHFSHAVEILTRLHEEMPHDPKVTHLLAICLREWYPTRIPDDESPIHGQLWRPEQLLEELVQEYPNTPAFQHALAESYSRFPFRPHEIHYVDLLRVEAALNKALGHARRLYEKQPTVPAYSRTLIHVHFQLGNIQRSFHHSLRDQDRDAAQEYMARAERNLRAAAELQQSLVRRFPDSLSYHLWLARYWRSLGSLLQVQHRLDEAITVLDNAIQEARTVDTRQKNTDSWHLAVASLHRELSFAHFEAGNVQQWAEHDDLARSERNQVQNQSLLQRRTLPRRFAPDGGASRDFNGNPEF